MSDQQPLVSVIIPVHNRAGTIGNAVASVIGQTFRDLELIVVDDNSSDDLAGALRRFDDSRIRLVRHDENRGASAARNTGIEHARGQICALLDSDDTWAPDKIKKQLGFLKAEPERRVSCTSFKIFTRYLPEGAVRSLRRIKTLDYHDMLFGCTISPGSTLMAERTLLQEVGPFDVGLRRLEDWEFLIRAAKISPIHILDEPLSFIEFIDHVTSYDLVATSCRRIGELVNVRNLPFRERMIFESTIQNELAVAAYRNGRIASAAGHFIASTALYPKEWSYFSRITRAIWSDILHISNFGPPNPSRPCGRARQQEIGRQEVPSTHNPKICSPTAKNRHNTKAQ